MIIVTTNRFDFGLDSSDAQEYFSLLRLVSKRKDKKIIFVANNPWEIKYASLRMRGKENELGYQLIRPFGYTNIPPLPANTYSAWERSLPCVFAHPFTKAFIPMLKEAGIAFKELGHSYGGPNALSQFRAFISIPYQTSVCLLTANNYCSQTMKMYENIAAGCVMLVPTPRYLRVLMSTPGFVLNNIFGTLEAGPVCFLYS